MYRVLDTTTTIRALTFVSAVAIAGVGQVLADTPFEPVRRPALIGPRVSPAAPDGFDFVIPRATTSELAEYAQKAGARAAVKWFCDAYAVESPSNPDDPSLRQLVTGAALTSEAGAAAADALVCPRIRRHLRETRMKTRRPLFCIYGDCDKTVRYRVMSHVLAHRGCESTDAGRAAFDAEHCTKVFLGRSRRATAFRFFTRRAARNNGCLQITLALEKPSVQLYDGINGCE